MNMQLNNSSGLTYESSIPSMHMHLIYNLGPQKFQPAPIVIKNKILLYRTRTSIPYGFSYSIHSLPIVKLKHFILFPPIITICECTLTPKRWQFFSSVTIKILIVIESNKKIQYMFLFYSQFPTVKPKSAHLVPSSYCNMGIYFTSIPANDYHTTFFVQNRRM